MLSAARRALGVLPSRVPPLQAAAGTRGYALEGMKSFNEHESAVENYYFNKEDERLLRKLLGKVKVQADTDETAAAHHAAADEAALRSIVSKYKMSDADIKAIVAWKHAHH